MHGTRPCRDASSASIVCADTAAMRRRIADALAERELQISLLELDDPPSSSAELEDIDAEAIVVLVCDVDLPREMATPAPPAPRAARAGDRRRLADRDRHRRAPRPRRRRRRDRLRARTRVDPGGRRQRRRQRPVGRAPQAARQRRAPGLLPPRAPGPHLRLARASPTPRSPSELFLSESTIKSHLSSAFAKFGVRSRKEAAALFLELEQTDGALPTSRSDSRRRALKRATT